MKSRQDCSWMSFGISALGTQISGSGYALPSPPAHAEQMSAQIAEYGGRGGS